MIVLCSGLMQHTTTEVLGWLSQVPSELLRQTVQGHVDWEAIFTRSSRVNQIAITDLFFNSLVLSNCVCITLRFQRCCSICRFGWARFGRRKWQKDRLAIIDRCLSQRDRYNRRILLGGLPCRKLLQCIILTIWECGFETIALRRWYIGVVSLGHHVVDCQSRHDSFDLFGVGRDVA